MVVTGACVSGVADIRDYLTLPHDVSFSQAIGVVREVRVIKDQLLIGAELIDRCTAAFALKELLNLAVSGGKDGSFSSSGDVDRIVNTAFGARGVKGVDQLFRFDSSDRNDEIYCADEVRG